MICPADQTAVLESSEGLDLLHDCGDAIFRYLLFDLKRVEAEQAPAAEFQIVVAAIVFGYAFWIAVPRIAIGFDVEVPFPAFNSEIKGVIGAVHGDEIL